VYDSKDTGLKQKETEYRKIMRAEHRQHKQEVKNMRDQYEYLIESKEKQIQEFVSQFADYKQRV